MNNRPTFRPSYDNCDAPFRPPWFDNKLKEAGGEVGGIPRYRVVWGQDRKHLIPVAEQQTMPYEMSRKLSENIIAFDLLDVPNGTKQQLSCEAAYSRYYDLKTGMMTKNLNNRYLLIPVVERIIEVLGIPRWFIERYKEPSEFGTEEAWEAVRQQEKAEHGIAILPPFPSRGQYGEFLDVCDYDEEGNKIFRELDDSVIAELKFHHEAFMSASRKSSEQKVKESTERSEAHKEKLLNDHIMDSETTAELERQEKHQVIFT